jgi:hypothetical protein
MSRAPRIEDQRTWAGTTNSGGKIFPDGPHKTKKEVSTEGAGRLAEYDDTTEDIHRDQKAGVAKLESRRMKPGYRN